MIVRLAAPCRYAPLNANVNSMPVRESEYENAARALQPLLSNLPPKIVAIDGRDGDGKTTLGRFLAWYFNVTLVETDLYLLGDNSLNRRNEEIARIVETRLRRQRPVIVEGVGVLQLLEDIGRSPDFHIYVRNLRTHWQGGPVTAMLGSYESKFAPSETTNLLVEVEHDG
jgi:hypothetical protein